MHDDEIERIGGMVREIGKIDGVGPDDDFYDAGFSSVNSLELLLQLEEAHEVGIPDDDFIAARSVRALHEMVQRLKQGQEA